MPEVQTTSRPAGSYSRSPSRCPAQLAPAVKVGDGVVVAAGVVCAATAGALSVALGTVRVGVGDRVGRTTGGTTVVCSVGVAAAGAGEWWFCAIHARTSR